MDGYQRTIKLLDDCDRLIKEINASLKQQLKEAEDELVMIRSERIVNETS